MGSLMLTVQTVRSSNTSAEIQTFQAETAESYNFGLVVDPIDGLSLSVDWWSIELEDAVSNHGASRCDSF